MEISIYNDFINECRLKESALIEYHTHHILPKFMGGTDDDINLVKLSYQDHLKSHIILANCFDKNTKEYRGNIYSAKLINNWVKEDISQWKASSGMLGKTHSSISKDKIGLKMKERWDDSLFDITSRNFKISNKLKNVLKTEEHRENMSKNHADVSGSNNPMFGKTHKKLTKKLIRTKMLGNTNSPTGPRNSFTFYKDGILVEEVFGQAGAETFCEVNGISYQTICKKTDTWKNWKCIRTKKK